MVLLFNCSIICPVFISDSNIRQHMDKTQTNQLQITHPPKPKTFIGIGAIPFRATFIDQL